MLLHRAVYFNAKPEICIDCKIFSVTPVADRIITMRSGRVHRIAIVALGISVFAGIKATAPDLKDTASKYFLDNNLMDINVLSTIGLTDTDIYEISQLSGVEAVMPSKFADTLIEIDGKKIPDVEGAQYSAARCLWMRIW